MLKTIELSRTQNYLEWLKIKLYLDSNANNARRRIVKRGEVYSCNLGQGVGNEECKERPCVIIQDDAGNVNSPNTIVAPITHTTSNLPIVVPIPDKCDSLGNVILNGNVLLGNIVCVSKARLGDFITTLDRKDMVKVDEGIAISVDIKRHYDKSNNILNDKLDYINRLKGKVTKLENELSDKEKVINQFVILQQELGFKDLQDLEKQIRLTFSKKTMDK